MKINKGYIVVGLIIAFTLIFELAAHADEFDHATVITFTQPVQIPGQVVPTGTYLFELADHGTETHVVQIFSADRSVLYGTFLTSSTDLQEPVNDVEVTFAEPEAGGPPVLLKWFYPGSEIGNEFVYSKQTEKQVAQDKLETIMVKQAAMSPSETTGACN
ncbi:MAG TPA: hypothetical protein VK829_17200 [Terriglobales bacterium]|jgi:hypothetical protein|nr:hypothetical protein [Terriglobales bacterium]